MRHPLDHTPLAGTNAAAAVAELICGAGGLLFYLYTMSLALGSAPPEVWMGDVARILYVHVPTAWVAMLLFLIAGISAFGFLVSSWRPLDWFVVAAVEVGAVLNGLLLFQGAVWARPTWGVYWTWDPRLTLSAVMFVMFVGVLLLRNAVDGADRRAVWTAAATVIAAVNVPITYMAVRWWRTMHQMQSSSQTMSSDMVDILWLNVASATFVAVFLVMWRMRIERARYVAELPPPLPDDDRVPADVGA